MSEPITVEVGEYAVIIGPFSLTATQHGQPRRDLTGDNLILSLAMALEAERERTADLLEACEEALTWQAEGENGDPIPEEYWTPVYRAFMARLREAIAKAKECARPDHVREGGTS